MSTKTNRPEPLHRRIDPAGGREAEVAAPESTQSNGDSQPVGHRIDKPHGTTATDADRAGDGPRRVGDVPFDLTALHSSMVKGLAVCGKRDAARGLILQHLATLMNPSAVHLWKIDATGKVGAIAADGATLPHAETATRCLPDVLKSVRSGQVAITELNGQRNLVALSTPLGRNGDGGEVVSVLLLLGTEPVESFLVILQLLTGYLALWESDAGAKRLRDVALIDQFLLKTIVQMTESGSAQAAARVCAEELRKEISADSQRPAVSTASGDFRLSGQVAIGVVDKSGQSCRLLALSGAAEFDARTELALATQAALNVSLNSVEVRIWRPEPGADEHDPLATLARLTGARVILTGPLRDIDDCPVGSWLVHGAESLQEQPIVCHALVRGERAIARIVTRTGKWGRRSVANFVQPLWFRWTMPLLIIAAVIGGLFWPVTFRVPCQARVQPVQRRFVAAPFAGVLREVRVEAGTVVQAGDILATMDDTDLRLELAQLQAEVDGLSRSHDVHRVDGSEVEAIQDGHKLRQAQARLALLESRESNLLIRSPIGGVILSEDLKRAEGIPVRIGETLFEVAPLNAMRLEQSVPADEIAWIGPGQSVELGLVSQPDQTWTSRIDTLLPNAEISDGEHVFIALAPLTTSEHSLRPGEAGVARIEVGSRPLWWTMFHRPWQRLRTDWGW